MSSRLGTLPASLKFGAVASQLGKEATINDSFLATLEDFLLSGDHVRLTSPLNCCFPYDVLPSGRIDSSGWASGPQSERIAIHASRWYTGVGACWLGVHSFPHPLC